MEKGRCMGRRRWGRRVYRLYWIATKLIDDAPCPVAGGGSKQMAFTS